MSKPGVQRRPFSTAVPALPGQTASSVHPRRSSVPGSMWYADSPAHHLPSHLLPHSLLQVFHFSTQAFLAFPTHSYPSSPTLLHVLSPALPAAPLLCSLQPWPLLAWPLGSRPPTCTWASSGVSGTPARRPSRGARLLFRPLDPSPGAGLLGSGGAGVLLGGDSPSFSGGSFSALPGVGASVPWLPSSWWGDGRWVKTVSWAAGSPSPLGTPCSPPARW